MESELVLVDREALLAELRRVFDPQTAETLLGVLDKVVAQVRATGVTHEDFTALRQIVAELAEAQQRTEQQVSRLELAMEQLAKAQQRTADTVENLVDTLGDLKGRVLEANYRDKVVAYFGRWLRCPQVVAMNSLWETLEGHLSEEALDDVILLDLVVRGRPRRQPEDKEVWLAVEVSAVIDREDVVRARRRATLLQQAGYRAIPVVAGERATQGAEAEAHLHKVAMLQDGRGFLWEAALLTWA